MVKVWHGHGMASVNQKRPHCVNQMGKTHSKHLAARHGRGTAWAKRVMCESAFIASWVRVVFVTALSTLRGKGTTLGPSCIKQHIADCAIENK